MSYGRRRLSTIAAATLLASVVGIQGTQIHQARAESHNERPITGGWTQNGTYVWGGTAQSAGAQQAFDATMTFDWPEAQGNVFVGQSIAKVHVVMNQDGTGTIKGFEMFMGSVDGRPGQSIFDVEATVTNFTDYKGTALCLGGTDGLKDLKCFGSYVGKGSLSGYWTEGSYYFDE